MDTNVKIFPKPKYDSLKKETEYNCKGSCTCKFLQTRTNYDKAQIAAFAGCNNKNTHPNHPNYPNY